MESNNERPITKKIGTPRMILALAGIAIVGIGAAWFGKNTRTDQLTQTTQGTQENTEKNPPAAVQEDQIGNEENEIVPEKSGQEAGEQPRSEPTKKQEGLGTSKIVLNPQAQTNTNIPKTTTEKNGANVEKIAPQEQEEEKHIKEEIPAEEQKPVEQKPAEPTVVQSPQPTAQKKEFSDGTYFANGSYVSPAGGEEVNISLTLKDMVVTDATFIGMATHPASKQWQGLFRGGYQEKVIGKPIKDLSLTVISGSSLTPKGFMDAVQKIKKQASNS